MIRAIIFDLGGVLIDYPVMEMLNYAARQLNVLYGALNTARKHFSVEFVRGTLSERDFWAGICAELGCKSSGSRSLWMEGFERAYEERPDMFAIVDELKRAGYKTGLLSNTEVPCVDFLKGKDLSAFDVCVFSCCEGTVKPEKKIDDITLERLGVSAHEAVFIDDQEENVVGAERTGMKGIVFKDVEQMKKELYGLILALNE